jgi:hypothetical protein
MLAPQTLRRPANWQDFEHLCYRLWREVWRYPEIQKNGRLGQPQNGVDIYGIPRGEMEYYGIQCKGKSEYNDEQYHHPQFTPEEIDNEITKAKSFTPKLKKLYFATTAQNDAKIQEHLRQRNMEHIAAGIFEVHIFSWEVIADLIDEHKPVHDWYASNRKYRLDQSVQIQFEGGLAEMEIAPKFRQKKIHRYQKALPASDYPTGNIQQMLLQAHDRLRVKPISIPPTLGRTTENLSMVPVRIQIANTGSTSIDDFKLIFRVEGDIERIDDTNIEYSLITPLSVQNRKKNVRFSSNNIGGEIEPEKNALVGQDVFISDQIYLRPTDSAKEISIKWKFVAHEFNREGELKLIVNPDIKVDFQEVPEEDPRKLGTITEPIEEYIVEIA